MIDSVLMNMWIQNLITAMTVLKSPVKTELSLALCQLV